jgi:uncharacterized membrane protein YbhN (UPF0104 family)
MSRRPAVMRFRFAALPRLWPAAARGLSLPGGLRPWILCLSLGFLLAALLSHGRRMLQLSLDVQGWLWLLLAVGLAGLSLVINGWAWGVVLRWRRLEPRWAELIGLHVATNLRKYLPGGIWHLTSRLQALRSPDAPLHQGSTRTAQALVVTLLDPLLAAVAALALLPLGGWQHGLAGLGLLPLLALTPGALEPLLQSLERRRAIRLGVAEDLERERTDAAVLVPAAGYPWQPLLAELVFVLLRFLAFACCVWAFDLQLSLDWWSWLAGFALAWTAGLVVPGAPGGLGVFEAVLLLRLSVLLPQASLLAVALSYRLVVTLADLLAAGLVAWDQRLAAAGLARDGTCASPPTAGDPLP